MICLYRPLSGLICPAGIHGISVGLSNCTAEQLMALVRKLAEHLQQLVYGTIGMKHRC